MLSLTNNFIDGSDQVSICYTDLIKNYSIKLYGKTKARFLLCKRNRADKLTIESWQPGYPH